MPLAERHRLNDYVLGPRPPGASDVGAADNAMIGMIGADGSVVSEPQAKVMGLFSRNTGGLPLASTVRGNPVQHTEEGSLPALVVLATRRSGGSVNIVVINQTGNTDVTATVTAGRMRHSSTVPVLTVNGPSLVSYNTPEDPDAVDLHASTIHTGRGAFTYSFPAHSVTGFTLTPGR